MTKTEFVKAAAKDSVLSQKAMRETLDVLQNTAFTLLASGEDVQIMDGIKLVVKEVSERTGRNPQTGESIVIPAHKTIRVKLGSTIKNIDIA